VFSFPRPGTSCALPQCPVGGGLAAAGPAAAISAAPALTTAKARPASVQRITG
jgi:hypothetical protein